MSTAGFLVLAPDAPWIDCTILNVSHKGACIDVGALAIPKMFGLAFTGSGDVMRLCRLVWRRGERVGVRFVSPKEIRQAYAPSAAGRADGSAAL